MIFSGGVLLDIFEELYFVHEERIRKHIGNSRKMVMGFKRNNGRHILYPIVAKLEIGFSKTQSRASTSTDEDTTGRILAAFITNPL